MPTRRRPSTPLFVTLCTLGTALLVTGCAGAGTGASATPPTPATPSQLATPATSGTSPSALTTPSTAPTPAVRTITIELKNGRVTPSGDRVELTRGEPFVLDITSDRDDEVHVHGFDEEIEVKAGDHKKVELTADRTGRFEVESHHPELLIVVLQIR